MPRKPRPLRPFTIIAIYSDNQQTYIDTVEATTAKAAAKLAPANLDIVGIFHGSLAPAMWADFLNTSPEPTTDYAKVENPHSHASYTGSNWFPGFCVPERRTTNQERRTMISTSPPPPGPDRLDRILALPEPAPMPDKIPPSVPTHLRSEIAVQLLALVRDRLQLPQASDLQATEELILCLRWYGKETGLQPHLAIGASNDRFRKESGSYKADSPRRHGGTEPGKKSRET